MFCPQCGNNIKDGAAFCGNCGWAVPVIAVQEVVIPIEKKCASCGTVLKDEAQFCPNCGQAVVSADISVPVTLCKECRNKLAESALFCGKCGAKVVIDENKQTVETPVNNTGTLASQVIMEQITKPAEKDKYLLSFNLKESGPYTIDQIIEGIKKGTFTENYYICKVNSSEWRKIIEIKTLESVFKKRTAFRVTTGLVLMAVSILIVIAVIFSLIEPVSSPVRSSVDWAGEQNVIDVNINTLLREINNNEARAQQLYGNKTIRTRGIVQDITTDSVWIGFELDIWSDDDYLGVLYVYPSDTSKLLNLRKGQTITVRGFISASEGYSPRFIYYAVIE
jgi:hypothetical protein